MSQPLPIGDYQWVRNNEDGEDENAEPQSQLFYDVEAIMNLDDESDTGYIFEVDLRYSNALHTLHNDFPFLAEKQTLSKEAVDILGCGSNNKPAKLMLTLMDKKKYVLHYRMLKLALQHGLVLTKVHRILQFKQSLWLKPYIDLNTELRKNAENDFEKMFFKLQINAIFGKTLENLRNRVNIKLINKYFGKSGAQTLIAKPNFKRFTIFDEDLVAIELLNTHIVMNKPMIIGMSILDISKLTMYSFLYNFIKPKFGSKCQVAYTDTDSFILDIETEDFYKDISENSQYFDTSDYPYPNRYNIKRLNKKERGLFKDEANGEIVLEFVGLRAKCYAIRTLHNGSIIDKMKKSKGVKKNVVKRKITFKDYLNCIQNQSLFSVKQNSIRSIKHRVFSVEQTKIGLNPHDDKRYIIKSDMVNTLAWGHFAINMYEEEIQNDI